jgi:hypothetical protein
MKRASAEDDVWECFIQAARGEKALIELLYATGTFRPHPVILCCHRARWLFVGFQRSLMAGEKSADRTLSLVAGHVDSIAAFDPLLAGAIACGLWDGLLLPESMGLASSLARFVLPNSEGFQHTLDESTKCEVTSIAQHFIGHAKALARACADDSSAHRGFGFESVLTLEARGGGSLWPPAQDKWLHMCLFSEVPCLPAVEAHACYLQTVQLCYRHHLNAPDPCALFGPVAGRAVLHSGAIRLPGGGAFLKSLPTASVTSRHELLKSMLEVVGPEPAAGVYRLATSFGIQDIRLKHLTMLLEQGHDVMAEDNMMNNFAGAGVKEIESAVSEVLRVVRSRLAAAVCVVPIEVGFNGSAPAVCGCI